MMNPDVQVLKGGGQCFPRAYRLMEKLGGSSLLCQGMVKGKIGAYHSHAWVEKDDVVYDDSLGKLAVLPKELYYSLGNVKDVYRYKKTEVYKWMIDTEHFGPWEGVEAEPSLKKKRSSIMNSKVMANELVKISKSLFAVKELDITNNASLYIKVAGKTFEVVYIAKSDDDANDFCEKNEDCGVIAEDDNLGLVFIAKY